LERANDPIAQEQRMEKKTRLFEDNGDRKRKTRDVKARRR